MRNYQRTRGNPYLLPRNLYRRVLYLVRDYDRLCEEYNNILYESPFMSNIPKRGGVGDPTANKSMRREKIFSQIEAVDQALRAIPEEYRKGVIEHVKYGLRFPPFGDRKTWFAYQSRFIYHVAKKLGEF